MTTWLRIAVALGCIAGCGQVYEEARPGELTGQVLVVWIGPGSDTEGDGRFIFVPPRDKSQQLTFHRPIGASPAGPIIPEAIYTDGGSIPRIVQPFKGFNPWAYAPAYMIHDWLFVARRCLNDDAATEREKRVAGLTFRESAMILAEVMKTMKKQEMITETDLAPTAISSAVTSSISRARWNATGECEAQDRLTPDHAQLVERLLRDPGQEATSLMGADQIEMRARLVTVIEVGAVTDGR